METTQEVKTIKIRRIPRAGFFNIASFARSVTTFGAELNSKGGYNTGLTPKDIEYFERELSLPPRTLTSTSKWWSEVFNVEHVFRLRNDKTNELVLDGPLNELRYKVLLASSKVANSETEKNNPGAIFYIDDVEAKAKKEMEVLNFKMEGMKLIFKSTVEEKRGNLRLFGKKGTDLMTEDVLNAELAKEMEKDAKNFFEIMTDKELRMKAFIKDLEEKHIITRKGNTYYHGEDILGLSIDLVIEYLNEITNKPVKLILETKLDKARKKITG